MSRTDMALGLAVLAVVGAVTYQRLYETRPMAPVTVKQEPQASAKIDKSPKKQAQRQKLIADLIYHGVFQKVETVSPTSVHVYVLPEAFNSLRFEIKQSYMSVVFTARFDDMAADKAVHLLMRRTVTAWGITLPCSGGYSLISHRSERP